jgi:hypothetical protein
VKRVAAALVLVSALVACGKEEWNRNQLGVSNPYADTDETEPVDDPPADATTDTTTASTPIDAGSDVRPADARADVRDATGQ